jgi:DNA replication protein DnaC
MAPFFTGISNAGKTYAAAAIVNRLSMYVPEVTGNEFSYVWAPVSDVFNTLTAYRDYKAQSFWELDFALRNADLVVFDDFGYLTDYPRHKDLFWLYVNCRYDEQKQTIFTSQFDLSDGWDSLVEHTGEGMARRMQEMAEGLMVSL